MNNQVFFGAAGDERGTPQDFFDELDREFHFDLDAAATTLNHKCDLWFGEGGEEFDALNADWGGDGVTVFVNPPYSIAGAFIKKAREEADKGATVVMLLPVRSDTKWWHNHVWDTRRKRVLLGTFSDYGEFERDGDFRPGVRCRLLPGRLNFELHIPVADRVKIKAEMTAGGYPNLNLKSLSEVTGLPKMALERIFEDQPDDCLLDSAPFPSCVVIFTKAA